MINIGDFDLRLLRIFKTVTDRGGFSAAESALNMNLSTISTHMADLEARVGIRLCQRGRRGFQLTEEGRVLYQAAATLLNSVEDFRVELGALHHRISGELRVGIVDNTISDANSRVSAAVRALKNVGGDLQISLEIHSPDEIEEALLSRKLHLGIGPFRHVLPALDYEAAYTEELLLYCARGHPLFELAPDQLEPGQLAGIDYVARGYLRESQVIGSAVRFKVAATVHQMEAAAMLVLSGRFVAYLPAHFAAQWVGQGQLRAIRPDLFGQRAEFFIVTQKGRPHTMAAQCFIDAMRAGGGGA